MVFVAGLRFGKRLWESELLKEQGTDLLEWEFMKDRIGGRMIHRYFSKNP